MFSILIPTYNYACTKLVQQLAQQAEQLFALQKNALSYEIIVGDDGSTDIHSVRINRSIQSFPHCFFAERGCNVGRASIRNWLAEKASQPYLIFIDSDAIVDDPNYLMRYYQACTHHKVICGGVKNINTLPSPQHSLRFFYEKNADRYRNAAQRSKSPYDQFTTFNFCIARNLFLKIKFNEQNIDYGYEDTYFGICLEKESIPILHIDNNLVHNGIDTNLEFLKKTESALLNLYAMNAGLKEKATVSRIAIKLKRIHLLSFICFFHHTFKLLEKRNLLGKNPSLLIFSLYKLGFYCCLLQKNK